MLAAAFDRTVALQRLGDTHFDVVVVGGGITGAGCALDAASRGLRTALVERGDFAAGTSSKSSKLVHGGLRYLQQGDVRLVYEALAERHRLRRNAPHLVKVLPFLIPVFSDGPISSRTARAMGTAMWMYDVTGGARIGRLHQRLTAEEARAHVPTLRPERLQSSYLYYDARADDARLCLTVARTAAVEFGAVAVNSAEVTGFGKDAAGRVHTVEVVADGRTVSVTTDAVVNATGVWADRVAALDESDPPPSLRPAKGVHLTVPWHKVANDIAVVLPVPGDDRSVFVVPWGELAYIGTTDTDYGGPLDDPQCTPGDVAYLLGAVNAALTTRLTEADVVGTWAGLRPLVADPDVTARTADLSRRHHIHRSGAGVVTVTGGKLTTYRDMAADTIDEVVRHVLGIGAVDRIRRRSRTRHIRLLGADGYDEVLAAGDDLSSLPADTVRHLADRYGGDARTVLAMAEADPSLAEPLVPGLPYLRAEALYGARYEMARSVDDVLSRRTRARLLARDDSARVAPEVAALIGPELGWDQTEQERQVSAYRSSVTAERQAAHLPEVALDAVLGA
ncbi:MAG TPA: glycerol-3-phosphate dehydrogenase/oxidase [Acidimicrobiales bacterium]